MGLRNILLKVLTKGIFSHGYVEFFPVSDGVTDVKVQTLDIGVAGVDRTVDGGGEDRVVALDGLSQCHQMRWAFASARSLNKRTGLLLLPESLPKGLNFICCQDLCQKDWTSSIVPSSHSPPTLPLLSPLKLLLLLPLHLRLLAGLPAEAYFASQIRTP